MNQQETPAVHDVIIIGAGFSGIGMAIKLRQAGIGDFLILERADSVGGTWRDNSAQAMIWQRPGEHTRSFHCLSIV